MDMIIVLRRWLWHRMALLWFHAVGINTFEFGANSIHTAACRIVAECLIYSFISKTESVCTKKCLGHLFSDSSSVVWTECFNYIEIRISSVHLAFERNRINVTFTDSKQLAYSFHSKFYSMLLSFVWQFGFCATRDWRTQTVIGENCQRNSFHHSHARLTHLDWVWKKLEFSPFPNFIIRSNLCQTKR